MTLPHLPPSPHLRTRPAATRRLLGVAVLAAALGLTGCGALPDRAGTESSAGGADGSAPAPQRSGDDEAAQPTADGSTEQVAPGAVVGTSTGSLQASPTDPEQVPLRLDVRSVRRVDGDAVEVRFALTNLHDEYVFEPWSTMADASVESGANYDVGGAALIDLPGDRRYLTLLDTDDVCLCSTFSGGSDTAVEPGRTVELYAQFPAPPESTGSVDFTLPGFAVVAGLEIG